MPATTQMPLFIGQHRAPALRRGSLVLDMFAGGGGASKGIEAALGRPIDIACNHDANAIEMHAKNHPETRHYIQDVWNVDPVKACDGNPIHMAWFSPDCRHFSRAKGGQPKRDRKIRDLAWVVLRWAKLPDWQKPRVIFLENVEEFLTWGPLDQDGNPDPAKKGQTFRQWLGKLKAQGYTVEHRVLCAADYGAPTSRRRLFLIARCDGERITWPEPTHGPGRPQPHRTAAECMDFDEVCPSIFDRARPLAENTLKRIAKGVERYVIDHRDPFVLAVEGKPAAPYFVPRYGERPTQPPRTRELTRPMPTVVGTANGSSLVAAFLTKHYGGPNGNLAIGQDLRQPAPTITAKDSTSLTTAHIMRYNGQGLGQDLRQPLATITTKDRFAEVRTLLAAHGIEPAAQVADIGMRMLKPRELFTAQGFPAEYWIDGLSKTEQVRLCGNSVPPPIAEALVRANVNAEALAA